MATITSLLGSTQIGNSDEIINQNFSNINNAIVEKTGDQSIAGTKTFTATDLYHDVTNNTTAPDMRRAVKRTKVKNIGDAGGVEFIEYVDADNSVVGNRKRALWGYLKKWADGATASFNNLFEIEYDTYDGDSTYTTRTTINTDSLYFGSQNLTGGWTSYTPTVTGTSGTVGTNGMSGVYKVIGKTCFCKIRGSLTKGTLTGRIYFSLPINSVTNNEDIVTSIFGPVGTTPATSYGYATPGGNSGASLEILKNIGSAGSRADHGSGTLYFSSNFVYQTV